MATLEDLNVGAVVEGLVSAGPATIVSVKMNGSSAATVIFRNEATGGVDQKLLFRADEHKLTVVERGLHWAFDGDGDLFRLVAEAHRIHLAYLFDPLLAVHVSSVEPLPHQIAAVYEEMPRSRSPFDTAGGRSRRRQDDHGGPVHQGIDAAGRPSAMPRRASHKLVLDGLLIVDWAPIHLKLELKRELDQWMWKDSQPHLALKQVWPTSRPTSTSRGCAM